MKKRFVLWSLLVLVLTFAATVLVYRQSPDLVASHWNGAGEIDGYGPRGWLFIQPALMTLLTLLWLVLPGISPEQFRVNSFSHTWWYSGMVVAGLLAYIQAVLLWGAWSGSMAIERALCGGIGVGIALLGNVIGKVRRNFWLGIRTPWTLANDRVWYATHRLAAKTMVASGLVMMAGALAGLSSHIGFMALIAGALVPAAYSLFYYKRLERNGGAGA